MISLIALGGALDLGIHASNTLCLELGVEWNYLKTFYCKHSITFRNNLLSCSFVCHFGILMFIFNIVCIVEKDACSCGPLARVGRAKVWSKVGAAVLFLRCPQRRRGQGSCSLRQHPELRNSHLLMPQRPQRGEECSDGVSWVVLIVPKLLVSLLQGWEYLSEVCWLTTSTLVHPQTQERVQSLARLAWSVLPVLWQGGRRPPLTPRSWLSCPPCIWTCCPSHRHQQVTGPSPDTRPPRLTTRFVTFPVGESPKKPRLGWPLTWLLGVPASGLGLWGLACHLYHALHNAFLDGFSVILKPHHLLYAWFSVLCWCSAPGTCLGRAWSNAAGVEAEGCRQ